MRPTFRGRARTRKTQCRHRQLSARLYLLFALERETSAYGLSPLAMRTWRHNEQTRRDECGRRDQNGALAASGWNRRSRIGEIQCCWIAPPFGSNRQLVKLSALVKRVPAISRGPTTRRRRQQQRGRGRHLQRHSGGKRPQLLRNYCHVLWHAPET